jgi:2-amino-4-hydroxy-6-hydroxymethyldihydropteridine diphosphokinase
VTSERVFVALGSNLGDRQAQLDEATRRVGLLEGTAVIARGPVLETDALLPPDDPTPQPRYLNSVVEVRTALEPLALLSALKQVERDMGRVTTTRWAPRVIDLDLVLFGARTLESEQLTLPHPGVRQRRFVLEPLAALAPELLLPDGVPVARALAALR